MSPGFDESFGWGMPIARRAVRELVYGFAVSDRSVSEGSGGTGREDAGVARVV